jgi:hypothetical protein
MTAAAETKTWAEMSPNERQQSRFDRWLAADGIPFASADAQAKYKANVTRLRDVIELKKEPDRVPIILNSTFMPANLYGVDPYDLMYDPSVLMDTFRRFLVDYQPDYYFTPLIIGSGKVLEILDCKQVAWPGHGVPKNQGYQYIEGEYMRDEEYRSLIDDPTDFWFRGYMPRAFGALEPFSRVSPFTDLWEVVLVTGQMIPYGVPDVQAALTTLLEAGREALAYIEQVGPFEAEARGMGFASAAGGISKAPFDILADTLRGTRSTMIDMHRRPDLVLEAVERLAPLAIKQGVNGATSQNNPIVFMPLHKGAEGFMSDEQFRTFYWPTLKGVCLGLIEEGCVPYLFCEGGYELRLEYLAELPPGTTFCHFDHTDMRRAKDVLRDKVCIGGNVPASLILTGTADEVKAYCKELIETVGPGGGYVMAFGTAMDEGKPETVHAMVEATHEYGTY